ncbi:unnamed protein product [Linum tenue]|uniref:Uncharacterized protein n=1 Tax=Linum tenue TaxID=586396 RepID=A0AAV0RA90_9ROSI|nr:unnamed protein product [Linum tenue]
MWKLKIAGDGEWVSSGNGNVGRQEWVFNPTAGTPEEKAAVEKARREFKNNRFNAKQSADLLMRMQLTKENPIEEILEAVKLKESEEITEEAISTTLRRASHY